jgi:monoamine oxidase
MFVNVDGQYGRTICPLPHAQLENPIVSRTTVEEWDKLSCQDRFLQIQHQLTTEEQGLLVALLLHISGGTMESSSLWDMIRSHALLMHSSDNFNDVWLRYKLREGQTALARRIFDEALESGLEYVFSAEVKSIVQSSSPGSAPTTVYTTSGETYQARKVITTIPLNVLKDITFHPPLPASKCEAIAIEHVNHMTKLHADVANNLPGLERWNGMCHPAKLTHAYADGVLSTGDIHLTAFGSDQRPHFIPENNPELAVAELKALHPDPMVVKKMVFHNWSSDPFSQGGPAWWRPGYMSKYQEALQARHGDVLFASADWAHGWRAAIDGAMEQGVLAARVVAGEIKQVKKRGGRSKL